MPWVFGLGAVAYLMIGVISLFVGAAARTRRSEDTIRELQETHPSLRSRLRFLLLALGHLFLWPLFAIGGKREVDKRRELDDWVIAVQSCLPANLSFETYRQIEANLPWGDQDDFRRRLSEVGYVITGFAKGSNGEDISVAISVLSVGTPFALTSMLDRDASSWSSTIRRQLLGNEDASLPHVIREWFLNPADEVWVFASDAESWRRLGGRAGFARVRENVVIDARTTVMN